MLIVHHFQLETGLITIVPVGTSDTETEGTPLPSPLHIVAAVKSKWNVVNFPKKIWFRREPSLFAEKVWFRREPSFFAYNTSVVLLWQVKRRRELGLKAQLW